jgi:oxygen-independent coproporphyrinogen-3 oxidase
MRLMCDLELDKHDVEHRFDIGFDEYFADALAGLQRFSDDGLVRLTDNAIFIEGAGRLLLRNIAMNFDAYLDTIGKNKPVFSRTV